MKALIIVSLLSIACAQDPAGPCTSTRYFQDGQEVDVTIIPEGWDEASWVNYLNSLPSQRIGEFCVKDLI